MALSPKSKPRPLFWIDLEMTGLDENIHHIIEVAVIITDEKFNKLEEFHRIVFQPPEVLERMDPWCVKTHGDSGLTAAIPNGKQIEEVEKELIDLLNRYFKVNPKVRDTLVCIAGNSVYNDKRFIDRHLPNFSKLLHYRVIDVSSFKEIFRELYGIEYEKKGNHRALDDVWESVQELKTYLSYFNFPSSK